MTDNAPDWLPTVEDDVDPEDQQEAIIDSDAYPMRVLAGAGTGKTFTMVRKIEHLIDKKSISPDRILALTFTNNAAGSMREKLNAKLGTAGYDIDAYTYHSICNELLTDYAYEAGIDPDFEVVSDAEKYAIVFDVLDEIEYRWVKPDVYGPDFRGSGAASKLLSFIGTMKRGGIRPDEIDSFLGPAERLYELEDLPDRIETVASDHLGGRSVSSVLDGLRDARTEIAGERDDLGGTEVEAAVRDFLDRLVAVCDAFIAAFEAHETDNRSLPENAHKLPKYLLGGYSSGAPSGLPKLKMELPGHLESFIDECLAARDLVAGFAAYERELDDRNLIDFDGLVVKTVDLLTGDVGNEVADRWEYVFCDEFQDTDRLQFELVTSLVSDDRLFVVGDDDQAIYEWRGARVANITTELTDEFGPSLTDKPLEENFRSRQPILDLANDLLTRLEERTDGKTLTRIDEPDYEGDTVAVVDEAEEEADRAQQLVTVTQNLLTGAADELDRTYDPGDIAVLVRKNDHAAPLLDAFDRAGIPYQVAGDLATESIGVGTVVAYLNALARPEEDEVSWNRVLTMRYRLTDADIRRLNDYDDDERSLIEELREAPLSDFEEPERVREARRHATQLLEIRDRASLSHLYSELKDVTNIEWYLSEQERRDLKQLDEVIHQYGQTAVQPPLTTEFIESLQHYESLFAESGSSPTDQPELADDAVNVMTVHKSKGLDFPVVLMPRLTADEWAPGSRTYDALEAGLSDGPVAVFNVDFVARDAAETRRVLHVGITRAEDILVLHGSHDDEDEDGDDESPDTHPIATAVDDLLPARVPWRPGRNHLPIWRDIHDCLPPEASDWTDTLASEQIGQVGGTVQYQDDALSPAAARGRVLEFASSSVNSRLPAADERLTIQVESLTGPTTPTPALSHSYTSLQSYEKCPRQHYLDHIVNAYTDYRATGEDDSGSISQRDIGLLFHDTAEQAANEETTDRADWYEICERLASQRRTEDALQPAKQCIDRYFELELSDYDIIDAEREFELDIDGHELIGFVDAIYRTPDGNLLVIDYKATERHRNLETDKQLPIYLLACRELYDEPVTQAGYAYVGDIGPTVETRTFSETELQAVKDDATTAMNRIVEFSFSEYSAGDHCRWCQHNQLPCAPDSLQTD
jgi:DNA helicase-2/ATP-dependent DNA helicase PcrA